MLILRPVNSETVSGSEAEAVKPKLAWLDMMRGVAVIAIVTHHWLLFMPYQRSAVATLVHTIAGTFVHLFFLISGCGLTISYLQKRPDSWRDWARRRFIRLVYPYWPIVAATFLLANVLHLVLPAVVTEGYSGPVLLAYLGFWRNFYSPAWELNPTLWFLPVILGLYVLFPFLIQCLARYGVAVLLGLAGVITYGSICLLFDLTTNHQSSIALFHVAEFALGMAFGYLWVRRPAWAERCFTVKALVVGVAVYGLSWAMGAFCEFGSSVNDVFTAAGIGLAGLYAAHVMTRALPGGWQNVMRAFSDRSYVIYLIHGPLVLYVAKPIINAWRGSDLHSAVMLVLCPVFCGIVFLFAKWISLGLDGFRLVWSKSSGGMSRRHVAGSSCGCGTDENRPPPFQSPS